MKRSLIITLCFLGVAFWGHSQITTTTGLTPTQYVNTVLLGNGVTASNITYTGYPLGISKFNASSATGLGFSSGIFLTTGSSLQNDPSGFGLSQDGPAGPSTNDQQIQQSPMYMNDHDLHVQLDAIGYDTTSFLGMGPGLTNDIAVLEFDFVPTSDTISFRYRFGSEEYNDFVQDDISNGFNDIFAFLLKGVTPAAAAQYPSYVNIALIPNTTTPVSIFSVNNGYSTLGDPGPGPCVNCAYYVDNYSNAVDVVYDGITVILTAKAPVICGQKYHIKLAVADVGDQVWDSGVFIEAGSFSAPGAMTVSSEINGDPNNHTFVENCNSGSVTLTRTDAANPQTIPVIYTGTAGATTDFTGLPNSVSFTPGQTSAQINLQAVADGLPEGSETFNVGFIIPSACGTSYDTLSVQFNVVDPGNIQVNAGNDIVDCNSAGIDATITAVVTGGSGTITYSWNTGASTQSIHITALGQYIVTVTDQCNQTASDTVMAILNTPTPLNVSLIPDFSICPNTPVSLQATPSGGSGTITYAWSNGGTSNPISLTLGATTTLTVTATDACGQTATDNITIYVNGVTAAFTHAPGLMGVENFTNQSTPNNLTYSWDFGDGSTGSTDANPSHTYGVTGTYVVTLTVTNAEGCVAVATQKITYDIPTEVFIPNTFTPNADGLNDSWRISISYIEDFELYVFDRWGQLVFRTDDLFNQWKGTYFNDAGKPLKCDRYAYRIIYKEYKGKEKEILGSVTLLK